MLREFGDWEMKAAATIRSVDAQLERLPIESVGRLGKRELTMGACQPSASTRSTVWTKEYKKEYQRLWRIKNREQIRQNSRSWRVANRLRLRDYARAYRLRTVESRRANARAWYRIKGKEYSRKYYARSVDKRLESARSYRVRNVEKIRNYRKDNASRALFVARKWRKVNQDKCAEYSRKHHLAYREDRLLDNRQRYYGKKYGPRLVPILLQCYLADREVRKIEKQNQKGAKNENREI